VSKATSDGVVSAEAKAFFVERCRRAYIAQWSAFADVVSGSTAVPVRLDDGMR
jgi:hypothetical protein